MTAVTTAAAHAASPYAPRRRVSIGYCALMFATASDPMKGREAIDTA
jgi:hypothetical protein